MVEAATVEVDMVEVTVVEVDTVVVVTAVSGAQTFRALSIPRTADLLESSFNFGFAVSGLGSGLRQQNWDPATLTKFEKNFYEYVLQYTHTPCSALTQSHPFTGRTSALLLAQNAKSLPSAPRRRFKSLDNASPSLSLHLTRSVSAVGTWSHHG